MLGNEESPARICASVRIGIRNLIEDQRGWALELDAVLLDTLAKDQERDGHALLQE